ncbi:Serine/arginine-rich splicing factor 4 [Balamuthia mandrillaris]
MDLLGLLTALNLREEEVLNVYIVGSRVWGTAREDSDWDVVVVMNECYCEPTGQVLVQTEEVDAYVINLWGFIEGLHDHLLFHLLCLHLPPQWVWLNRADAFLDRYRHPSFLSLPQLRCSVSAEASRTWCKAKKKWTVEHNPALAKKDLVHALRELMMAVELAETGSIKEWSAANEVYYQVMRRPRKKNETQEKEAEEKEKQTNEETEVNEEKEEHEEQSGEERKETGKRAQREEKGEKEESQEVEAADKGECWKDYHREYRPLFNALASRLKRTALKDLSGETKPRQTHLRNPTSAEEAKALKERILRREAAHPFLSSFTNEQQK